MNLNTSSQSYLLAAQHVLYQRGEQQPSCATEHEPVTAESLVHGSVTDQH